MLSEIKKELSSQIALALTREFSLKRGPVLEVPPRRELGDLSSPVALHVARELKQRPRNIAEKLAESLELPSTVSSVAVEGAGYLNFRLDRRALASALLDRLAEASETPSRSAKVIIEHTNINPNKAAHIGHLRNAVLGDVLARCYRAQGYPTEVQNYIDDTGVQLADVVVGFCDLRGAGVEEVANEPEPFDFLCWDLYSAVGQWYEQDRSRLELRRATLHALERDQGERAEMGRLVARRIVRRHLGTMARLDIGYDLLTKESEILRLAFFDQAFERLKHEGAVRLEEAGKNQGCWVMPLSESHEFEGLEDPDKVIVRSDGTVTYVGKDIAYQLWKFGLLGRDFEYRRFPNAPLGILWETGSGGPQEFPAFGSADRVINVIDARQSYLQRIVRAGLEALGYESEAARSIHFAYEMVSLSARTAQELGFFEAHEDAKTLEMSGRKGIGVKADDLLDRLEEKSRSEVESRNRELSGDELIVLARQLAVAAVRYFMVKTTTTRVIAFDLEQALSFEGDSGPYLQYSLVRAKNILKRLSEENLPTVVTRDQILALESDLWSDDLWDLVHAALHVDETVGRATETLELSLVARAASELAQKFHALYHRHPILREEDPSLRTVRLAMTLIFQGTLRKLSHLLGIPEPERM